MYSFLNCGILLINGRDSGGNASIKPARISSPYDALEQRVYNDNTSLFWDFANVDATSTFDDDTDACLVFSNAWAQEGFNRPGTHNDFSDTLVNNIANRCANTIVVIHNAGIRLVDRFESNPNVKAIIFAHLPANTKAVPSSPSSTATTTSPASCPTQSPKETHTMAIYSLHRSLRLVQLILPKQLHRTCLHRLPHLR